MPTAPQLHYRAEKHKSRCATNQCQYADVFLESPFWLRPVLSQRSSPSRISMEDIIKAAFPFLGLQFIGLIICIKWPIISLYLPHLVFGS